MAALLSAAVIVAGPAAMWLAVHGRGWETLWVIAAMSLALTLSVALAGVVERELTRRSTGSEAAPAPGGLSVELREQWRVLLRADVIRTRVGEDGQLAKMIRQGDPIDQKMTRVEQQAGRPRVRVGGRLLTWSEITQRWDAELRRLVILGDPGYGKTVAALMLVKRINARSEPGASVAELFSLSEWQRWRGEHQAAPLGDWLAAQLTLMHPQLDAAVARELVDARLVLPVLDGLDEIATVEDRRACVAAIDAYAERGAPHRPFVLTCRAPEYYELAPDWVRDDERVVLVGLQPDQIQTKLAEPQIAGRAAWNALRQRQAAGDATIDELFRSPLRLSIALQVYRDGDPSELLTLTVVQAREHLWGLLLAHNAHGYRDATPAQVRAWLAWLAAGMRRTRRQRFFLHELYLLDPHSAEHFRVFGIVRGLFFVLLCVLGIASTGGLDRLLLGLALGLLVALSVHRAIGTPQPSVRAPLGWRKRLRTATTPKSLLSSLGTGLVGGLVGVLVFGLALGLAAGLVGGLTDFLLRLLAGQVITAEPPRRFAYTRPDAVLTASRSNGLLVWLAGVLVFGLAFGLVYGLSAGLVSGLVTGLLGGLLIGLICALLSGLDAWSYHHWLRRRLTAQCLLPAHLPVFLEWCAEDARGWLRISDAYEFRHGELLEHLAPATPPTNRPATPRHVREG
jgi:hypothetical protein